MRFKIVVILLLTVVVFVSGCAQNQTAPSASTQATRSPPTVTSSPSTQQTTPSATKTLYGKPWDASGYQPTSLDKNVKNGTASCGEKVDNKIDLKFSAVTELVTLKGLPKPYEVSDWAKQELEKERDKLRCMPSVDDTIVNRIISETKCETFTENMPASQTGEASIRAVCSFEVRCECAERGLSKPPFPSTPSSKSLVHLEPKLGSACPSKNNFCHQEQFEDSNQVWAVNGECMFNSFTFGYQWCGIYPGSTSTQCIENNGKAECVSYCYKEKATYTDGYVTTYGPNKQQVVYDKCKDSSTLIIYKCREDKSLPPITEEIKCEKGCSDGDISGNCLT